MKVSLNLLSTINSTKLNNRKYFINSFSFDKKDEFISFGKDIHLKNFTELKKIGIEDEIFELFSISQINQLLDEKMLPQEINELQYSFSEIDDDSFDRLLYMAKKRLRISSAELLYEVFPILTKSYMDRFASDFDENEIKKLEDLGFSVVIDIGVALFYEGEKAQMIAHRKNDKSGIETCVNYTQDRYKNLSVEKATIFNDEQRILYRKNAGIYFYTLNINDFYSKEIKVIYDANHKLQKIIVKEPSKVLEGVFDRIEYGIDDFGDNYQISKILQSIKDGSIKGGKIISKVDVDNLGNINYVENIQNGNCLIQREYMLANNDKSYSYSYRIFDDKKLILNNQITFDYVADNKAINVINNQSYELIYDDKFKTIQINKPDGTSEILDISKLIDNDKLWKVAKKIPANLLLKLNQTTALWHFIDNDVDSGLIFGKTNFNDFNQQLFRHRNVIFRQVYDEKNKEFIIQMGQISDYLNPFEEEYSMKVDRYSLKDLESSDYFGIKIDEHLLSCLKKFNIALLINLLKTPNVVKNGRIDCKKYFANFDATKEYNNIISSGLNISTLAHELGHVFENEKALLYDEKLKEIYHQEMNKIDISKISFDEMQGFKYFFDIVDGIPVPASFGQGLEEVIAETCMILVNYGDMDHELNFRSQLLVEHFPKTIAYIASSIGFNAIDID